MDFELLKKNIKTNRQAQTEIYSSCYKRVYASCLRIVRDAHDAEDLMQEAFIHAFRKIDSFRGEAELSTWICRIAIIKCLDHLKKRRVELCYDEHWVEKAEENGSSESVSNYDVERIKKAMQELPEGCRIIFTLHIFEEMDHKSIASKLGIKEGSSRAQYARAKNKIQELVTNTYV
ncbi:MAG: RNA polymerase sigma factor [Cryomorphaceae bacterium]